MALGEAIGAYVERARELDAARRAKRTFRNVEGTPFWPHEAVRDTAIIAFFMAVMLYFTAILPFFLEEPASQNQPAVILPDWYLLWAYGQLKIAKNVEFDFVAQPVSVGGPISKSLIFSPVGLLYMGALAIGLGGLAYALWSLKKRKVLHAVGGGVAGVGGLLVLAFRPEIHAVAHGLSIGSTHPLTMGLPPYVLLSLLFVLGGVGLAMKSLQAQAKRGETGIPGGVFGGAFLSAFGVAFYAFGHFLVAPGQWELHPPPGSTISAWLFLPWEVPPMSGLTLGTILNGVYVVPLILIPFIDPEPKVQRPVEQPFWTALGLAACWSVFMFSIYSVDLLVYGESAGWSRSIVLPDFFVIPILDLLGFGYEGLAEIEILGSHPLRWISITYPVLGWVTWASPIVVFYLVYWTLAHFKRKGGYEANINKTYYKVR
ncbi:MAG: hypothetical protein ACT4PT_12395 [Methanobacteriota archaeon]